MCRTNALQESRFPRQFLFKVHNNLFSLFERIRQKIVSRASGVVSSTPLPGFLTTKDLYTFALVRGMLWHTSHSQSQRVLSLERVDCAKGLEVPPTPVHFCVLT